MTTTHRTKALSRASIACLASLLGASAAHAVDWTGYMRGGPAALPGVMQRGSGVLSQTTAAGIDPAKMPSPSRPRDTAMRA